MAVEKSYAKLGFFIVVALIVVLGTAALFIQRLRSREAIAMVTYTTDNVFGLDVSSPVRYRGVPVGRVTDLRVDPRGNLIEIDFEVFLHRLNTIGMNVKAIRTHYRYWGRVPSPSGPDHGQPTNRGGVLVARFAGESPTTDGTWVQTESALRAFDALAVCNRERSAA